jgi:hypothetical protein
MRNRRSWWWWSLVVGLWAAPAVAQPRAFIAAGVGFPELFHAEVGSFVTERITLEIRYGNVILNNMIGVGGTYAFGAAEEGRPPRHALLLSTQAMINPTLGRLTLVGGGDVLAASLGAYVGYSFLADWGLYLRVLAGGFLIREQRFGGGPNVTLAVGFAL